MFTSAVMYLGFGIFHLSIPFRHCNSACLRSLPHVWICSRKLHPVLPRLYLLSPPNFPISDFYFYLVTFFSNDNPLKREEQTQQNNSFNSL